MNLNKLITLYNQDYNSINKKKYSIYFIFPLVFFLTVFSAESKETQLTLDLANRISKEAFACAGKKSIKISVAIVNSEGNLILFNRDENSYVGSIDASISKAKSSNDFKRPTSAFTQAIKNGRLELLSVKGIVALEGGVPIVINNQHLGSIGISGGRSVEDEECALKALEIIK